MYARHYSHFTGTMRAPTINDSLSEREAVEKQQATRYLVDGRDLGTKMVKFQGRDRQEK